MELLLKLLLLDIPIKTMFPKLKWTKKKFFEGEIEKHDMGVGQLPTFKNIQNIYIASHQIQEKWRNKE